MSVTTVVLPDTDESKVCLGFAVKLDSEVAQLDQVFRALSQIKGARIAYLDSKKLRIDVKVPVNQKS